MTMSDATRVTGVEYLAIAPAEYLEALEPLLEHRRKDFNVKVVTPQEIDAYYNSTYSYYDSLSGNLHRYITDLSAASQGSLHYILLVGDDTLGNSPNDIPIGYYPTLGIRSDAYYGDVDGDTWPELAVGRIPAKSKEELALAAKKIIKYESTNYGHSLLRFYAGSRTPFYEQGSLQHRFSDSVAAGLYTFLEGIFYTVAKQYIPDHLPIDLNDDFEKSAFYSKRNFIDVLNAGATVLTYIGHGNPGSISTRDDFSRDPKDLEKINIKGEPPVLNLLACNAGCFAGNDCLGEALAVHPLGPIAVIGSGAENQISPVLLTFFGNAIASQLNASSTDRLGDIFRKAQHAVESPNELLWKAVNALPTELHARLALNPTLPDAALLHGLQITLLGDPATAWRIYPSPLGTPLPSTDPRQQIPKIDTRMEDRITLSGQIENAHQLDSKSFSTENAAFLLHLLDYATHLLHQNVVRILEENGYRKNDVFPDPIDWLPQLGGTFIEHGNIHIPLRHVDDALNTIQDPTPENIVLVARKFFGIHLVDGSYLKRYLKDEKIVDLDRLSYKARSIVWNNVEKYLGVSQVNRVTFSNELVFKIAINNGHLLITDIHGIKLHFINSRKQPQELQSLEIDTSGKEKPVSVLRPYSTL